MLVYHDEGDQRRAESNARYVPYTFTRHDADGGYYDFVQHPDLIPSSLEDFRPFGDLPAIERFYALLTWLNGPRSCLESTDCLLRPVDSNGTPHLGDGAQRQIVGRLMVIYRDHRRNTFDLQMQILADLFHQEMLKADKGWKMGACGYAFYPAHFTKLGEEPIDGVTTGHELCIRFWAWGNTEGECFQNLDRLFCNLHAAIEAVSRHVGPTAHSG